MNETATKRRTFKDAYEAIHTEYTKLTKELQGLDARQGQIVEQIAVLDRVIQNLEEKNGT